MFVFRISRADGGVVLLHQDQGPFSVTVFVSPEAAHESLTEVSVLVQTKKNGDIVLDAAVSLAIDPPAGLALGGSEPFCSVSPSAPAFQPSDMRQPPTTIPATRAQASNKLLYAAPLKLNLAGDWRLHVNVFRGPDTARFDCLLPVAPPSVKPPPLWPWLLLPSIVIIAFSMNQILRRRSLESLASSVEIAVKNIPFPISKLTLDFKSGHFADVFADIDRRTDELCHAQALHGRTNDNQCTSLS